MRGKINRKRQVITFSIICALFLAFLAHLFDIQVVKADETRQAAITSYEVNVDSVRGEILDRNGYPLVTNKQVNKIVFSYTNFPTDYTERNKIIIELIRLFDKNHVEWNDKLPIELKKNGKLAFVQRDAGREI